MVSRAAQAAADSEKDYTAYAGKAPTDLQQRFHDWILDKVELDPSALKSKAEAFKEGVRLGVALRMEFQASPENQEALADQRAAVEKAKAEKADAKKAKKAKKAEEAEEETPKPKAAKKTKAAKVEEAPAPKPAPKTRRPAKRARAAEAPF